jgi:hypothetical protein
VKKKNVLLYLMLFVLIFITGCAKKDASLSKFGTTDLQKHEIREKVKSMRIVTFLAKDNFGKAIKESFSGDIYYQFNDNGFISEETHYYYDGQMDTHIVYKRDDNMRILELNENTTVRYCNPRTVFNYDNRGNNIEQTVYEVDGTIAWKTMFNYDANNNLIEEGMYDNDGTLMDKSVYTYDKTNQLTGFKKYGDSFELLSAATYKYFEAKNTKKNSELGKIREEVSYDSHEVVEYTKSYKYNDLGLVTEETTVSPGSETNRMTYEYEYNSNKDWIRKVTFFNSIPTVIEERQFNVDNNRPATISEEALNAGSNSKLQTEVYDAVYAWNDAHNTVDLTTLNTLYADRVSFYGTTISKDKAVSTKKQLLTGKYVGYSQSVSGLSMSTLSDGIVRVDFAKITQYQGRNESFNAYLELSKSHGTWKITKESDETTDKNLRS